MRKARQAAPVALWAGTPEVQAGRAKRDGSDRDTGRMVGSAAPYPSSRHGWGDESASQLKERAQRVPPREVEIWCDGGVRLWPTDSESNVFSPARFATRIKRREAAIGVFFKGRERQEMLGFANRMRHIKRAGQFLENPPTGNRSLQTLVPLGTGAAAVARPVETGIGLIGVGIFRLLSTSPAGRSVLLAASRLESGSPKMAVLVDQLNRQLPRIGGTALAETDY